MKNQQLDKYVSESRAKGMADSQIQQELLKGGWNMNDINESLFPNPAKPLKLRNHKLLILSVVIIVGILILSFVISVSSSSVEEYKVKASITKIQGLDNNPDRINIFKNGKGSWFLWKDRSSWNNGFYTLKDTTVIPLKMEKEFYPSNPMYFGKPKDLLSHPESPAAYSARIFSSGIPYFTEDKIGDDYLIYNQSNPNYSLVYRLDGGIARPFFDAPNNNLGFKSDGAGNFYAFIVNALTGGTSIYRIRSTTMTEIKGLQNGYDYALYLDGPSRSYVVLTYGKGPDRENPDRYQTYSVYKINGDEAIKITDLDNYNSGVRISFGGTGEVYATAESKTDATGTPDCPRCNLIPNIIDFYKIEGGTANKISKIPGHTPQKKYNDNSYSKTQKFEDVLGNVYEIVTKVGEPFWNCELFKVDQGQRYSVIDDLNDIGCADLYTDNKGTWLLVEEVAGFSGTKTNLYKIDGSKAYNVEGFKDMRLLKLFYDDSGEFWYGTTDGTGDDTNNKNLYKISFD